MTVSSAATPAPEIMKMLANDVRWNLLIRLARSDHRVHELVRLLGQPMNLVSYHLKQLRDTHLVTERRSSADGRDVYYSLDLDVLRSQYFASGQALHPALATTDPTPVPSPLQETQSRTRVLFLCTHNSARSQMAEGILRHFGGDRIAAFSAGSAPAMVHPDAIRVLARMGIDISQQRAKHLDEFADQPFDYIVTVCDRVREACPVFPDDPEQVHWSFPDPVAVDDPEERERVFEQTAQQLLTRIRYLITLINRHDTN